MNKWQSISRETLIDVAKIQPDFSRKVAWRKHLQTKKAISSIAFLVYENKYVVPFSIK